MAVRIGDEAPNFTADTTEGEITFHDYVGDGWCVLFSHPKVANAAVVGMPDPRLGERICAYVILDADAAGDSTLTVEEVQVWMQEAGLAKPKWPERIEVVDAFPMTASGKVQKFRLREMIAARIEAETAGGT